MSPPPIAFIEHLRTHGYHPRSDKHSNALGHAIVTDLLARCPAIADRARMGTIVYDLNTTIRVGITDWNVDLVLGAPAEPLTPGDGSITRAAPSTIQIAIEFKSVMTEHRKAVKNRKRDLEAHHEHVHNYNQRAIAAGVLIINEASTFKSPLRPEPTTHTNPQRLVEHCIHELRSVSTRGGQTGYGLEAKCALVVNCDNIDATNSAYSTARWTPSTGDPLHYDAFIQSICEHYRLRFNGEM